MNETGYITLWDVECVYIVEDNDIIIIPKHSDDIRKINSHFDDQNFVIKYHSAIGCAIAFIERVEFSAQQCIKLFPKYIINRFNNQAFSGFEITGEAIDCFFSPSRYFYDRAKLGVSSNVDLIYHSEIADQWAVFFENKQIKITLSYGDILRRGVGSDLMLHPKLTVAFDQTDDTEFVYRVYSIIVRFLRIVRYDLRRGKHRIELYGENDGKRYFNGCMYDFFMENSEFSVFSHEIEYGFYKPYIGRFLQFSADNPQYAFHHYPTNGIRYRGRHYSAVDFLNIFSAFESECNADQDLYKNADTARIQRIKDSIINLINEYPSKELTSEEKAFLDNAKQNLLKQGTEFGQRKKIKKAYRILQKALETSIGNIFFLPEFRCNGDLSNDELDIIVEFLVGQRGTIAHGGFFDAFSDADAQKIHFLEILTYAQLLKRIGLDDIDIERVIGIVFGCNYIAFQERNH